MTTRTTLRLGGLTAAIVMSLALVSSASAAAQPRSSGIQLHRSGLWVQHKGAVVHQKRVSLTAVPPMGPADRHGGLIAPAIPVTQLAPAESSGFAWGDAAIGAL